MITTMVVVYTAAGVIAALYAVLSWRRRTVTPLARSLAVIMAGAAEWSLAQAASLATSSPTAAIAFSYAIFPGVAAVVGGYYWHATVFAGPRRPRRALLLIEPALLVAAVATDPWHHAFFRAVEVTAESGVVLHPGPLYWLHTAYSYALLAYGTALVVRAMRRSVRAKRRVFVIFLVSGSAPVVGNLVTVFADVHAQRFDFTPLLFLLTGILWWWTERSGLGREARPVAYAQVIAALTDAVIVLDPDGRFLDVNPAAGALLATLRSTDGAPPGHIVGKRWQDVVGAHLTSLFAGDSQGTYTMPSGAVYDMRIVRMRAADGTCPGSVVVVRDITELERLRTELTDQAVRDSLTGVHNRRHLTSVLDSRTRAATAGRRSLSVVMIDIDHFKSINDRFGHAAGDRVLVQVARDLSAGIRPAETLVRYGGEEFVVVMPDVDAHVAAARAEQWRRRCAGVAIDTRSGPVSVTFSAGVAQLSADAGPDDLLRAADAALYRAKDAGRNRVHVAGEPSPRPGAVSASAP